MGFMDMIILGLLFPVVLYFKDIFLISKQAFSYVMAGQKVKCQARGHYTFTFFPNKKYTSVTEWCPWEWYQGLFSIASPSPTWAITLLSPGPVQSLALCPRDQLFFPQYWRSFQISTPNEGPAYILQVWVFI